MREVLFKAKRIDNGEWVEGCLITRKYAHTDEVYEAHIVEDAYEQLGVLGFGIHPVLISPLADKYVDGCFRVDINTICQYTDLTDKNGNKIWENDVVRYYDELANIVKEDLVKWNKTHASFTRLHESRMGLQYLYIDEGIANRCEVIGNIFDNPELMGE